jgi:3-methylcrotonyl-CoA carboxylase alpha subunit
MEESGVPTLSGYHGDKQDLEFLQQQADKMGYPILIKAVSGGGGKGMKLVGKASEFKDALNSAKREGKASFGDDTVLLEKYLIQPRHVEIQIFADNKGNTIHLCERDCSLQRRHQKVLEEAPAPHMTESLRKKMGEAAINAAKSVNYSGAGTVEFLLDKNNNFYFMEMNTRLQVEHPITEMITNVDLVEWQLHIANNENLPLEQKDIKVDGHAFEARIYAENPRENFLPQTGKIQLFATSENARLDTGVASGDEISPFYDPMIAKLIVWGENRTEALENLAEALANTHVVGLQTNVSYLHAITQNKDFKQEKISTSLLEKHHKSLVKEAISKEDINIIAGITFLLSKDEASKNSPWNSLPAWRLGGNNTETLNFMLNGEKQNISITHLEDGYSINTKNISALLEDGSLSYEISGKYNNAVVFQNANDIWLSIYGEQYLINSYQGEIEAKETVFTGNLTAPTSGTVIQVNTKAGEKVTAGHDLIILEAMKTEYRISAPENGKIKTIHAKKGDHVNKDSLLIHMITDGEQANV